MTQNDHDTILARLDGLSARMEGIANDVAKLAESVDRLLSLLEAAPPGLPATSEVAPSEWSMVSHPAAAPAAPTSALPPSTQENTNDCFVPTKTTLLLPFIDFFLLDCLKPI